MWDCNAAQDAQFFPESAQVQGRLTPTLIAYSQWLIAEWFGIVCICNAAQDAQFFPESAQVQGRSKNLS